MEIKLVNLVDNAFLYIAEQLYIDSYPESERKGFEYLIEKAKSGAVELLGAFDVNEEDLYGLAFTVPGENLVYLDYVAVNEAARGQGIGSAILAAVKEYYSEKRIVADIETTLNPDRDQPIRLRRKSFYRRSGFNTMNYTVNLLGIEHEILSYPEPVEFEEYLELLTSAYGEEYGAKIRKIQI